MSKEHIGYIVAILSVIASGIISWYFYDKSQQHREPVYSADPFPSAVFKVEEGKDFPLKVTTSDGKPILESIYLATHYFWNKGERPILEEDILKPLEVTFFGKGFEILNVTVSKYSREVVGCTSTQQGNDTIQLDYKVLESNDGCGIDILYIGEKNPDIEVDGTIIGVERLELYTKTVDEYFDNLPWYNSYKRYVPGFVVIVPFAIILIMYLKAKSLSRFKFWSDALVYILFICQIYFIAEIRLGHNGFSLPMERPQIKAWESTVANKPVHPTAEAAAD